MEEKIYQPQPALNRRLKIKNRALDANVRQPEQKKNKGKRTGYKRLRLPLFLVLIKKTN
jgi:hypothetical protein